MSDALDDMDQDGRAAAQVLAAMGCAEGPDAAGEARLLDDALTRLAARQGITRMVLPRIRIELPREATLQRLTDVWPTAPDDLFPRWMATDIAAVFVAGLAGAFTSAAVEERYGDLHDGDFARRHAGETIDRVPGQLAGGPLHRLKYGHDILRPFEVDWTEYAPQKGLTGLATALWPWLMHLLQDTFSREGLPGPGTSYFRDFIQAHAGRDEYQELLTVKARDVTGAALTTAIIEVYSRVAGMGEGALESRRGYRHATLTFGAHMVGAIAGLAMPSPTVNGASMICAAKAAMHIVRVARYVDGVLAVRDEKYAERAITHAENELELDRVSAQLRADGVRLADFGARLAEAQRRMHANALDVEPLLRLLEWDALTARQLLTVL